MPNQFVGHLSKWLLLAQSDTDFAVLFVRAWIPYNAWYVNNYQNSSDRFCIDKLKTDNNQFKSRIIGLLTTEMEESIEFKYHLCRLQKRLEQYQIPDASNPITFKSIYFRDNPITVTTPHKVTRGKIYKAEKHAGGRFDLVIVQQQSRATIYSYNHKKYDLSHFKSDINNSSLSKYQRETAIKCFEEINPKVKENLLSNSSRFGLKVDRIVMINSPDLIAQGLIEILYALRNKLFHGELLPSRMNLSIYEPAYFILRILLKSLI